MAEAILKRIASGDREAVASCLDQYGGLVWSIARKMLRNTDDAEDAVQEIFVDLWKSAVRFDPAVASEAAFIAMISRRRLIDRIRSAKRRREVGETAAAAVLERVDPGLSPDRCVEAAQAVRALDALRPEQREVLLLSTCQGLSHDEIAEKIGMPLGTVKAHVRRGLLRIRAALLGESESLP